MTKPMDFHNRITAELASGKNKKQICTELSCCYRTLEKYRDVQPKSERIKPVTRNTKGKVVFERIKTMFESQKAEKGYISYTAAYVEKALSDSASEFNTGSDDFDDLSSVQISGTTIRRYCREVKKLLNCKQQDIFNRLDHYAGEAQADFGQLKVFLQGQGEIMLDFFVLTFPYSNMRYFVPVWGQNIECVIEGFSRIVEHIGCVPKTVRFDNMSSAVSMVLSRSKVVGQRQVYDPEGHPRVLTEMFVRFMNHFGFKAEFCNTASGWEKGHVEGAVKFIKNNFFGTSYSFDGDWDSFQTEALSWCDKLATEDHYEKKVPIKELFELERTVCLPLPKPFAYWKKEHMRTMATEGSVTVDGYCYRLYTYDKDVCVIKKPRTLEFYRTNGEQILIATRQYHWQQKNDGIEQTNWKAALEHSYKKIAAFRSSPFAKCLHEDVRDYICRLNADQKRKIIEIALSILESLGSIHACVGRLEEAYRLYRHHDVYTIINAFRDDKKRDSEKLLMDLDLPDIWDPKIARDTGMAEFLDSVDQHLNQTGEKNARVSHQL